MKEIVAKFLKVQSVSIMVWISVLFIGVTNSTLALIIYSIIIHASVLMLVIGLYVDDVVVFTAPSLFKKLFKITESLIILIILIMSKHWYTFCISLFCMFLLFVHISDYKTNVLQMKKQK